MTGRTLFTDDPLIEPEEEISQRSLEGSPEGSPEDLLEATPSAPSTEFEIVVGKRQIASLAFLALVLLAMAGGGSYLAGKAASGSAAAPSPPAESPAIVPDPPPASSTTVSQASIQPAVAAPAASSEDDKPLHDVPIQGVIYIQMGALEQGIAEILTEGFRRRGFPSFVAPGPNEHIFRVLVGPFKNAEEYDATRQALTGMGLEHFVRRYEQ